jgi:hypothetical protein
MKPMTLIVLGAAGVLAYTLFNDGKTRQQVTTTLKKAGLNLQWSTGVPVDNMLKNPNAYVNQVDYYTKNPNESWFDSLFRNLP